jgi:hypothetical protein
VFFLDRERGKAYLELISPEADIASNIVSAILERRQYSFLDASQDFEEQRQGV